MLNAFAIEPGMKKYFFSLFGKQHEIQNKLLAYIEHTETMALDMEKAVRAYLSLDEPEFSKIRARIDEMEHRLDLLRREIEEEIYGRHLLRRTWLETSVLILEAS